MDPERLKSTLNFLRGGPAPQPSSFTNWSVTEHVPPAASESPPMPSKPRFECEIIGGDDFSDAGPSAAGSSSAMAHDDEPVVRRRTDDLIERGFIVRVKREPDWPGHERLADGRREECKRAIEDVLWREEGLKKLGGFEEISEEGTYVRGDWQEFHRVVVQWGPRDDSRRYIRRAERAFRERLERVSDGRTYRYSFSARRADGRSKNDRWVFLPASDRKREKQGYVEKEHRELRLVHESANKTHKIEQRDEKIATLEDQLATTQEQMREAQRQYLRKMQDLEHQLKAQRVRLEADFEARLREQERLLEQERGRVEGMQRELRGAAAERRELERARRKLDESERDRIQRETRYQQLLWDREHFYLEAQRAARDVQEAMRAQEEARPGAALLRGGPRR
eukprot:tig00020911_g15754.t1